MTVEERKALVSEGFACHARIAKDSDRLEEIKDLLTSAASGKDVEFHGTGNEIAAISFHPQLARKLDPDKEPKAQEICGGFYEKLFQRAPIKDFSKVATALLSKENLMKLLKLLSGPPSPRVSFRKAD